MGTVTHAPAFRKALRDAAEAAINDDSVQVVSGYPWPQVQDDIVAIGEVRIQQEPAALGTRRPRNEILEADVVVSSFRTGGQESDDVVTDRAFELLGCIEEYVRLTDTTLGGIVWHCFLTVGGFDTDPLTNDDTGQGRVCEVRGTFTAQARIT